MKSVSIILKHQVKLLHFSRQNFSRESNEAASFLFNPYNKELVSKKQYLKKDELFTKLSMAAVSFRKWKEVPLNDRVNLVKAFVDKIIS
jgi:hypothetical protein